MKKIITLCKSPAAKLFYMCMSLVVMLMLCILSAQNAETETAGEAVAVTQQETEPAVEELSLYAQAAVLLDAESGRVLYSKNGDEVLAMASTTKILTCILALENGNLDDSVTVSAYAASMPKVKLYIREGETYTLRDLLYSLMLESHNDSAVAIAEHIGGSVEGFTKMMNDKARELGCDSSLFLTPNGLDATLGETGQFHSTTATDLARIMAYCVNGSEKKEEFLKITQTQDYSFTNSAGRSFSCHNHNALLSIMEGTISGKTGFTNKAGYCYVGAVKRDDRIFTVALLACGWPNHKTYKWKDCQTLFQYGFETYHYQNVWKEQTFTPVKVKEGIPKERDPFHQAYVEVKPKEEEKSVRVLLKDTDQVEVRCLVPQTLEAPVQAGTEVGSIVYTLNGEVIHCTPIVTVETVNKKNQSWITHFIIKQFLL